MIRVPSHRLTSFWENTVRLSKHYDMHEGLKDIWGIPLGRNLVLDLNLSNSVVTLDLPGGEGTYSLDPSTTAMFMRICQEVLAAAV